MLSIEEQVRGLKQVRSKRLSCPFIGNCEYCTKLFSRRLATYKKRQDEFLVFSSCPCHIFSSAYIKRVSRKFVKDNDKILVK